MDDETILTRGNDTCKIYRRGRYSIVENKDSGISTVIGFPDEKMYIEDFPTLRDAEMQITILVIKFPEYT